ncbi:MAG: ABC transporter ATP-binding protein/permease [Chloroflexota bacterium]|nr:ABC transporter ATP-binding protein/permease [Chloroflexota bacterium]
MPIRLGDYRRLLGVYLRPQWPAVLLLAVLLVMSIGLQLVNPQIVRSFIDTAQGGARGAQSALLTTATLFIAVALAQRAVAFAVVYLGENVGWRATNELRADLTRHCLRLDLSFYKTHTPGDLIERVDGDVTLLVGFFSRAVVQMLGNALLVLGILALLFRVNPWLGAGLGVYTLATVLALRLVQRSAVRRWAASRQASAEHYGFLEEHLAGTEEVRANGAEEWVMGRFYRLIRALMERQRGARLAGNLTYMGAQGLYALGYALGLGVGAYLYTHQRVSIGTAYVIVYYIGMLSKPLEQLQEQARDMQRARAGIGRIRELQQLEPEAHEAAPAPATLPAGAPAVVFQGVSFTYDHDGDDEGQEPLGAWASRPSPALAGVGRPSPQGQRGAVRAALIPEPPGTGEMPALPDNMRPLEQRPLEQGTPNVLSLNDVSFRLEPGQVMGLLGRTGSGKTTLARLLFRLYDPTTGSIHLDGADLRDVALADLRAHVGMVTQDVQLFGASVRDNLTFFNPRIPDRRIEAALEDLGLWEWYRALPAGLDTILAPDGGGLSAGQAQLLAFARVFLRDPGLVILDEASSRLDPGTERLLERAVDRLLHGRTAIVIAHRLRTVRRADTIMVLEHGRVAEYGPRERLAQDPDSQFARLLHVSGAGREVPIV